MIMQRIFHTAEWQITLHCLCVCVCVCVGLIIFGLTRVKSKCIVLYFAILFCMVLYGRLYCPESTVGRASPQAEHPIPRPQTCWFVCPSQP